MKEEIRHRRLIEQEGFSMLYHVLTLDKDLSDKAFRLYALLLKYAQQKDHAYPGMERLGSDLGKSRQAISVAMTELEVKGLISRQRRSGTSSITWIEDPNEAYCKENLTTDVKKTLPKEKEAKKKKKIPGDYLSHCAEVAAKQEKEKQWTTPMSPNGLVAIAIEHIYTLLDSEPPRIRSGTWIELHDKLAPILSAHNAKTEKAVKEALNRFHNEKPKTFDPWYKSFPGQFGIYLGQTNASGKKVIKVGL